MIDLSLFQIREKIEITFKYFIPRKNQFEIGADREDFFRFVCILGNVPSWHLTIFKFSKRP